MLLIFISLFLSLSLSLYLSIYLSIYLYNNNTGFDLGYNTPIMKFSTLSIPLLGPCNSLGIDGVHWAHIRKVDTRGRSELRLYKLIK